MGLEQDIIDKMSTDMAKEIDYDMLVDLLKWTRVDLPKFSSRHNAVDIADWCTDNCTGKFMNFGAKFAFEKSKDAEWFILRWR